LTIGRSIAVVTERLDFQLQPGTEDRFLVVDEEIYGRWLRQQRGFTSRQIVRYAAGRVAILNFWKDMDSFNVAAKKPDSKILDAMMKVKVGNTFRMTSSRVF
jgi:hypothetical protein